MTGRTATLAAEALGAALVPARCAGCDAPAEWLCHACRTTLEPQLVHAGGIAISAAGAYEGPIRRVIRRFKYRDERALAAELGALLAELLAREMAGGGRLDALHAVPLHPDRVRERGYDHTLLLSREVSARTGLPVADAVRRIRHARPQVDLDRSERQANVAGAFVGCRGSLAGLRVAIVDDVATTGATCAAVARAARACGARSVAAYVVALDQ